MSAFDYLNNNLFAILKPSKIQGIGFFAIKDIDAGVSIFQPWKGESDIYSITLDELHMLPDDLISNINGTFDNKLYYCDKNGNEKIILKEYGKIFFPLEKGYHWVYLWPKMFLNSATKIENINVDTISNIDVISTKKIYKGEELLCNNGTYHKFMPKNFL